MDTPPPIIQQEMVFSEDFIRFIKILENEGKIGFKNNKWFPHASYEGGAKTIAYGHKIKNNADLDRFNKGITDEEAIQLLKNDLQHAYGLVKTYMNSLEVKILLSNKQIELLTELSFNVGNLRSFPKFVQAIINQDWEVAKLEYKRYSGGKALSRRNNLIFNRYLK
jgi:hypothetical protein